MNDKKVLNPKHCNQIIGIMNDKNMNYEQLIRKLPHNLSQAATAAGNQIITIMNDQ